MTYKRLRASQKKRRLARKNYRRIGRYKETCIYCGERTGCILRHQTEWLCWQCLATLTRIFRN